MKILAVTNNKGGVGKTTTARNVAAALVERGHRVLLVDLDDQANLTFAMGAATDSEHNAGALMLATPTKSRNWPLVKVSPNLYLVPSHDELDGYLEQLREQKQYQQLLGHRLRDVGSAYGIDYTIIDCPPNLTDGATNSALCAAQGYLVPTNAEPLSVRGLKRIIGRAEQVQRKLNPALQFVGFVFTQFNPNVRGQLRQAMLASVTEKYGAAAVLPNIRQDVALSEDTATHASAFEYAPDSRGVQDYRALTAAILSRF